MSIAKIYVVLASITLLVTAAGCGLLATVTPGPESIASPTPTVVATDVPTATPEVQVSLTEDVPQTVEAPTATPAPLRIVIVEPTVAATDEPPATPAPPRTISACTRDVLQDPPVAYAEIIDSLTELWVLDPELCSAIAGQAWIIGQEQQGRGGGTIDEKRSVLESIRELASVDLVVANLTANAIWFSDGLTFMEALVIHEFSDISIEDAELARIIAGSDWFIHGDFWPTNIAIVLADLRAHGLISTHRDLTRTIARHWLGSETHVDLPLSAISNVASADIELAMHIATLPGLTDEFSPDEISAIVELGQIASADIELVRQITSLPWFVDGIDWRELDAIERLATLAFDDVEAAWQIVVSSWFTDGIDYNDRDRI